MGNLAKPEQLVVYESILNNVQLLVIVNDHPTCFGNKSLYENTVSIGTPMPTKPSGQKDARETFPVRVVSVGLLEMMFYVTHQTHPTETRTSLGRKEVLDTLRSNPVFSWRT